jgi:hypothetical protein
MFIFGCDSPVLWLFQLKPFQLCIFRATLLRLALVQKEFARSHCTELWRWLIQQRL